MNTLPTAERIPALPRREPTRPIEPSVSGPRRLTACARDVAALIEADPGLWPALTTCVTDTNGLTTVHYAAVHGGGLASSLFGPDGVVSRWRARLHAPTEARRERSQGRERVVTLRGHHSGYAVTVLFTVLSGTRAPDGDTPEQESER
ncbi:hypothetical protein ACWGSK_23535 [Nocardiopsis sp. NPDC055551]|uniref:hypothetical protein n=1 Tax=Nocardiopsis sp. NPDC006832 TaxID=3157188 RepID=UPI0033FBC00C